MVQWQHWGWLPVPGVYNSSLGGMYLAIYRLLEFWPSRNVWQNCLLLYSVKNIHLHRQNSNFFILSPPISSTAGLLSPIVAHSTPLSCFSVNVPSPESSPCLPTSSIAGWPHISSYNFILMSPEYQRYRWLLPLVSYLCLPLLSHPTLSKDEHFIWTSRPLFSISSAHHCPWSSLSFTSAPT